MKSLLVLLGLFIAVQANSTKRQYVPCIPQNSPCAIPDSTPSTLLPPDNRLILKLDFNKTQGKSVIADSSAYANNGILMGGAILVNFPQGRCGNAAYTYCGDILFHGDTLQAKPLVGVTIAAWINLKEIAGSHSIFDTIGSSHGCGQYHFEVNNGIVRWFHRNESQITIFSNVADGHLIPPDKWTHVLGTYDSNSGKSKIYINGVLCNMTIGSGLLSRDWTARAGIGNHKTARPLKGFIDDFRIYNYALNKSDIIQLVQECGLLPPVPKPTPAPIVKKKPFADLRAPSHDNAPIDAVTVGDDYLPLKTASNASHTSSLNNDSVEEAVLKRSKLKL